MKIYHIQIPSEELGVPQRGIVPPLEAHRERSETQQFLQKLRAPEGGVRRMSRKNAGGMPPIYRSIGAGTG
jgi:hypothetical protein